VAVAQGQALGATGTELAGDLGDQGQPPLLGGSVGPPARAGRAGGGDAC
jgi:hypothetical protein